MDIQNKGQTTWETQKVSDDAMCINKTVERQFICNV